MYGSARARLYYGAGDYSRHLAMAQGYYPGGGFFDFVKKAVSGVTSAVKTVSAIPGVSSLVKALPVVGTIASGVGLASDLLGGIGARVIKAGGVEQGPSTAAVKQLAAAGALPQAAARAAGISGLPRMQVERATSRSSSRRRRTKRKPKSTGRTSSRRRRRGDYGDDWQGNTPSRAKGSGQFLTRAGGRRRHRTHRRHHGRGQRVSFTTKSGKRVSFTAKGDGDDVA